MWFIHVNLLVYKYELVAFFVVSYVSVVLRWQVKSDVGSDV